jgi:hypothetical protein
MLGRSGFHHGFAWPYLAGAVPGCVHRWSVVGDNMSSTAVGLESHRTTENTPR